MRVNVVRRALRAYEIVVNKDNKEAVKLSPHSLKVRIHLWFCSFCYFSAKNTLFVAKKSKISKNI